MSKSIYCAKDPQMSSEVMFGIKPPYGDKYWSVYECMQCPIGLKTHLGWGEDQLKQVLRKGNIWQDFPAKGYTLVGCEFKPGDEDQRVDLLYIRNDGGLLPCELKIGGESFDTHGQLIRYIADLYFQGVNLAWVQKYHQKFLGTISNWAALDIQNDTFYKFITDNGIEDRFVRILPKSGVIMDEYFKPQLLKTVRYLNEYCGFSIRLIQIETFVADDWNNEKKDYLFRIDFTDVQ